MRMKFVTTAALALAVLASAPASPAVIVSTLPEFNGDGTVANTFIGTFNYVIPFGDIIVSADFASAFGNSQVSSSAQGFVTVDGVTVGSCPGPGNPCYDGPGAPISYNFLAAEFALLADGSADLYYNQTGCCAIRLPESTLTINTRTINGAVPEPGTWAMMLIGFGAVGGAMRRRRKMLPAVA